MKFFRDPGLGANIINLETLMCQRPKEAIMIKINGMPD